MFNWIGDRGSSRGPAIAASALVCCAAIGAVTALWLARASLTPALAVGAPAASAARAAPGAGALVDATAPPASPAGKPSPAAGAGYSTSADIPGQPVP